MNLISREELRRKLDIEKASLSVYDLLANDLRSDKFQAYVLEEVFTELVEGATLARVEEDAIELPIDLELVIVGARTKFVEIECRWSTPGSST